MDASKQSKPNRTPATDRPLDELIWAVRDAIRKYDATSDHTRRACGADDDCIRCKLLAITR